MQITSPLSAKLRATRLGTGDGRTYTLSVACSNYFGRIATGEANAVTAVLRGEASLEGDWNLVIVFQRLFPSPS